MRNWFGVLTTHVGITDITVSLISAFSRWQVRSNVIHASRIAIDANPNMPAAALNIAAEISVFFSTLRTGTRMAGLRNELINDAVEILLDEHVVVTVKDNAYTMLNQQLMNWFRPTRSILRELIFSG
jgi:hypothetical protein